MIGEYVGNQKYQHLVKYEKTTILFYAIVENNSADICLPISETHRILTKYGLDKVPMISQGTYATYDTLCDKLEFLFK